MTKTLNTLNFLVKRGLERPNAPPILGLVELPDADARIETLRRAVATVDRAIVVEFEERNDRRVHFHDRVLKLRTVDEGPLVRARYDITAGIDNLMNRHKECKVFMELL